MHQQQDIYDYPQQNIHQSYSTTAQNTLKIKQSLIEAFTVLSHPSPNTQLLNISHKTISQHLRKQQILSVLFDLISQYSFRNQTFTKLIITQVFTYLKRQHSFGYEERHDKLKTTTTFLHFFLKTQVLYKFKKMLENAFMQFIFASHNVKVREYVVWYVQKTLTEILGSTQNSCSILQEYSRLSSPISILIPSADITNEQNLSVSLNLMHVIKCLIMGGNLESQLIKKFLSNAISIYFRMTVQVVRSIQRSIAQKQQLVFVKRVQECARYSQILLLLITKTDSGKLPLLRQQILRTRQLYQLSLLMMNLSTSSFYQKEFIEKTPEQALIGAQLKNEQLTQEVNQLISQLNFQSNFLSFIGVFQKVDSFKKKIVCNLLLIKKHALQILIKCIKTLQRKKGQIFHQYKYSTTIIANTWLKIKDCLIIETEKYLKKLQTEELSDSQLEDTRREICQLFAVSIKFLSQVVNCPSFYAIVSPYQTQIVFHLCFPWMISRRQHAKFQPEDYLYFRQDIINKQNMSYIENNIANLLQSYLDNIDGVVMLIMKNSTLLIESSIQKNKSSLNALNTELRNSWLLYFYSSQKIIEASLTLIAVESYLSLKRNDIALILEKLLYEKKSYFLQVKNDYRVTVQFLMTYSYYVDNFYSNLIQGISSQDLFYRSFHQEVLKFCCYLMEESYNYEKNTYKGRIEQILYLSAIDCLNNSLNHTEIVPALYIKFPRRQELLIPNYMLPYENYPFFPGKNRKKQLNQESMVQGFLNPHQRTERQQQQKQNSFKKILVHYRKIGLNKNEYIERGQIIEIIKFLIGNLETRGNIKVVQILIEFLIGYIKQQMKNQGGLINIPFVFRDQVPTILALKIYSLLWSKNKQIPNRGLLQAKVTELIYVLHSIAVDPYYIYSLGWETLWGNAQFWNFDPAEDDSNIDKLLKCTDLVVRLSLKHYSSQKGVNINQLISKISRVYMQFSYQYVRKMHKFKIIFGILLNLVLLKSNSQEIFDFLYLLITQKLMKAQLKEFSLSEKQQSHFQIPSSQASNLLSQSFYILLANIYLKPASLPTDKNIKLLTVFTEYLMHFVNAHKIVTQLGDVFGKIFACCLCIIQQEYVSKNLKSFNKDVVSFLWRNILHSGKIYNTQLQNRVVAVKLLSLIREIIRRNDPEFPLDIVEQMYQTACSCVFYSKNKDILMHNDEELDDFNDDGQEQEWENQPITISKNETGIYIDDQVLILKNTSKELLQSANIQIKQWISRLIESLPVAVRNFIKNKVINYQQQSREIGLRKIIKVKRPQNQGPVTKRQIVRENIQNKNEQLDDEPEC